MSDTNSSAPAAVSIAGLLGVAFVVLKLCHIINWSWWLVMLPFWIGPAVGIACIIGSAVVFGFILSFRRFHERKDIARRVEATMAGSNRKGGLR